MGAYSGTCLLAKQDTGTVGSQLSKLDPLFRLHGLKYEQCVGSVLFFSFLVEPQNHFVSQNTYNVKHIILIILSV